MAKNLSPTPKPTNQSPQKAKIHIQAELPEGMRLRVTVESAAANDFIVESQVILEKDQAADVQVVSATPQPIILPTPTPTPRAASPIGKKAAARLVNFGKSLAAFFVRVGEALVRIFKRTSWESGLLWGALLVYAFTRFVALPSFPIYFFTDEAVQTVLASDLVRDGFHAPSGELFPTYFYNSYQYNLGTSVYLQVLPFLIWGKSIWLTRGVSVLVTCLGAACVGLTLKNIFKLPYAFAAVLFLSITPAWFLHSRTAFETAIATCFFACFIYCYLKYRTDSPKYLYLAAVAGALTFYSYSPARMVIGVLALLLLLVDSPYHWKNRKLVGFAFLLTLLLAVPFALFLVEHPDANAQHLRQLSSYWIEPIPFTSKLGQFFKEYFAGLDPRYWYLPNDHDLARHLMKGYGHELLITAPFALIGLGVALWNIRKAEYRTLILALLAAPAGAALVALGITRALSMVIPLALLSGLGLSSLAVWLTRRLAKPWLAGVLTAGIFVFMGSFNGYMAWDAITRGPLWYNDYGLGGMQYGGQQLFGAIADYQSKYPQAQLLVSPSWANGTDTIARFFFSDPMPFKMGSVDGYFFEHKELNEQTVFVMIPDEYKRVLESGKFTDITIDQILPHPNGETGFYFIRMKYVDNIDQILEGEREARRKLQESTQVIDGEMVQVKNSYLDMGPIDRIFDGDVINTLIRSMEANPLVIEVKFPTSHEFDYIAAQVGGTPSELRVLITDTQGVVHEFKKSADSSPVPHLVEIALPETISSSFVRLEIRSIYDAEPAHVHVWEVYFKKP